MSNQAVAPAVTETDTTTDSRPAGLKSLARIINWPFSPVRSEADWLPNGGIKASAEIRTKRFVGHSRVEEERYSAEVTAPDSSASSIMTALARAFGEVQEFTECRPAGEPLVLEIRLRV